MVNTVFDYSLVFHEQGADQLIEMKSLADENCLVKIPSRIWNALCKGVYGAIMLLLLPNKDLRYLYQNVADGNATMLLNNIKYMLNVVDKTAIDVLESRLNKLKCETADNYHAVRNDMCQ